MHSKKHNDTGRITLGPKTDAAVASVLKASKPKDERKGLGLQHDIALTKRELDRTDEILKDKEK